MGFGNSKRMDLVKDLLKDEKKKKNERRKVSRSLSAYSGMNDSCHSKQSQKSSSSRRSASSSASVSEDPFHAKRIVKIQKLWEKAKVACENDPMALGGVFLKRVLPTDDDVTNKCPQVVEGLDCLIYMLGPDMDKEDVDELAPSFDGIPTAALGDAFAECMNTCLDKTLSDKDLQILDSAIGMVLRDML